MANAQLKPPGRMTRGPWPRPAEFAAITLLWVASFLVLAVFGLIAYDVFAHGFTQIDWQYLTTPPEQAGRAGGISTIIVGTLAILAVALGATIPIGLATAIHLSEVTAPTSVGGRVIRRSLDVLSGVPSIVFGLFGMTLFCEVLGFGWSILSGGLTLACMVLPLMVRATEEGLSAVPHEQRAAAAALGMSRRAALWHVILPQAAPGLAVALILSVGRALAETAALLFTAGAAIRMPGSVLDSARSLSYHIYLMAIEVAGGEKRAYAAAAVLLVLVLCTNLGAHGLARLLLRRRGAVA